MTQISKIYHDPEVPKKPDVWETMRNSNGDWMISRNGRVVKVTRTEQQLADWWKISNPDKPQPAITSDEALKRAIGQL